MILLNGIRTPGSGIVFKGQILECWLPSYAQPDLPYDPMKLPAIRYGWKISGFLDEHIEVDFINITAWKAFRDGRKDELLKAILD